MGGKPRNDRVPFDCGRALVGSAKPSPTLRDLSSRRVRRPLRFRLLLLLLRIGGLDELLDKRQSLLIRESNCRPGALSIQEPHLRSIDSCEDSNEREANSNAPMRRLRSRDGAYRQPAAQAPTGPSFSLSGRVARTKGRKTCFILGRVFAKLGRSETIEDFEER